MPRRVVPTRVSVLADSRIASSSWCSGKINVAFSAIRKLCGVTLTPCPPSRSISSSRACGSITTPLPITDSLPRSHHARRQQRQLVGDPVDNERMSGIMSTLEADHDVGLLGQPIDDLPLPLVPPLGTNHDHIGHAAPFPPTTSVLADLAASNSDLAATRDRCRDILEATKACPELRPDGIRDHARRGKAMAPRRNDPVCGPTA